MYDTQIIIQITKVTQIGFCESFRRCLLVSLNAQEGTLSI